MIGSVGTNELPLETGGWPRNSMGLGGWAMLSALCVLLLVGIGLSGCGPAISGGALVESKPSLATTAAVSAAALGLSDVMVRTKPIGEKGALLAGRWFA
ncbi:MAG: hypothetical protein WCJ13_03915 [Coriobacteriia bacterium]